jgi:SAM-dependent methyltransferase
MPARFIVGDAVETLRKMESASVDLVVSSPPFLALRSYLPSDDPNKPLEMGSEQTPGEFIDRLLGVVEECRRVLAPHGSLVFELGDTYAGSGGGGGDYLPGGLREGQPGFTGSAALGRDIEAQRAANAAHWRLKNGRPKRKNPRNDKVELVELGIVGTTSGERMKENPDAWPLAKSLTLIPELLRITLVYGFNPLTGRKTPRWRARNVVRWIRPNPPVGALADKFRPATSEFIVVCVDRSRYFDLEAVRKPSDYDRPNLRGKGARRLDADVPGQRRNMSDHTVNPGGTPPLDWFEEDTEFPEALKITAGGYRGAHFAVFPEKVVGPFIESMCPRRVCMECGKPSTRIVRPSTRIVRPTEEYAGKLGRDLYGRADRSEDAVRGRYHGDEPHYVGPSSFVTEGWTDCGHNAWRRGIVLDPFAGTGTVLAVAVGSGRDAVGIDIDKRNLDLARERIGMFLEIED